MKAQNLCLKTKAKKKKGEEKQPKRNKKFIIHVLPCKNFKSAEVQVQKFVVTTLLLLQKM